MLTEQPVQELQRVLSETLVRHFVWAKHVLPALKPSPAASALFISEGAGGPGGRALRCGWLGPAWRTSSRLHCRAETRHAGLECPPETPPSARALLRTHPLAP